MANISEIKFLYPILKTSPENSLGNHERLLKTEPDSWFHLY